MGAAYRGLVLAVAVSIAHGDETPSERPKYVAPKLPHRANNVYPDGVFPHSTKLTEETFSDFVEDAIVDEKTAIIRFIAGEG